MDLKIPINRSHVKELLKACWATLRGQHVTLNFKADEAVLDGKDKPVIFTEEEVLKIEHKIAQLDMLLGYIREALADLPEEAPEAKELRAALAVIERPRVLH
jgi:hypothetical protein